MKRTLAVIIGIVVLTLTIRAAEVYDYAAGAWYDTKAPKGYNRTAGELRVVFLDDYSCGAYLLFNGDLQRFCPGHWFYVSDTLRRFTFTSNNGTVFNGTEKYGYVSGSYVSSAGAYKGKLTAILTDDIKPAPTLTSTNAPGK